MALPGTLFSQELPQDQVVTWLLLPGAVALILGVGGIWLSRCTP
jgi:hypothetical protein